LGEAIVIVVDVLIVLIGWLTDVYDFLSDNFGPAIEETGNLFVAMGEFFQDVYDDILVPIAGFLKDTFETAIANIGTAIGVLQTVWDTAWGAMQTVYNNVIVPVAGFLKDVFEEAIANIGIAIDVLQTVWDTAWSAIETVYDNVIEPIASFLSGTFSTAFDAAGEAVGALGDTFTTVWGGITDTVETAVGLVKTAINLIIRGWNSISFDIPDFKIGPIGFDGFTLGLTKIPELAEGGIATGPQLAIVGDNKSGKEAIVPLERASEFGFGGGDGAGVTIEEANFYNGTDADLVAQKMYAALSARRAA
jgi:phage-related protein